MKEETPITKEKQKFSEFCTICEKTSVFETDFIFEVPVRVMDDSPKKETYWKDRSILAHCLLCIHPGLFGEVDTGNPPYYRIREYPLPKRHLNGTIPESITKSFEEAAKCEEAQVWIACVTMMRRTLEAVCKEFAPTKRSIFDALNEMKEKGLVNDDIVEWAQQLRYLGNIGAHAGDDNIIPEDAKDSMDFLSAIIDILYNLNPKFDKFKTRRSTKAKP